MAIEINRNCEDRLIKLESKLNSIHVNDPSENQQVSFKFGLSHEKNELMSAKKFF